MEKHNSKSIRRNSPKDHEQNQPQPMSGSHKVKTAHQTGAKQKSSHDM